MRSNSITTTLSNVLVIRQDRLAVTEIDALRVRLARLFSASRAALRWANCQLAINRYVGMGLQPKPWGKPSPVAAMALSANQLRMHHSRCGRPVASIT
jgi:hypothetical protein